MEAKYLALMVFHLQEDEILAIDAQNYAVELRAYRDDLLDEYGVSLDISKLLDAFETFSTRADEAKALEELAVAMENQNLIQVVNHKYRDFQQGFISQGGLSDHEFYIDVINAPGVDTAYAAVTFPGITEGIQYDRMSDAEEWISKTSKAILRSSMILKTC